MSHEKTSKWFDNPRSERFECVVPEGLKTDLTAYAVDYHTVYGILPTMSDVVIWLVSNFLVSDVAETTLVRAASIRQIAKSLSQLKKAKPFLAVPLSKLVNTTAKPAEPPRKRGPKPKRVPLQTDLFS